MFEMFLLKWVHHFMHFFHDKIVQKFNFLKIFFQAFWHIELLVDYALPGLAALCYIFILSQFVLSPYSNIL